MAKKEKTDSDGDESTPSPAAVIADVERLARLMRQASHAHGLVPVQWEALRYLARANRYSNAPGALARYLGTTKGTISQTLLTLEKRGLIAKKLRGGDSRSITLALTPAAEALLAHDPQTGLIGSAADLGGKTARRFARAVSELLASEARRSGEPSFGNCLTCKHLRVETDDTLLCEAFAEKIAEHEVEKLCLRHEAGKV
jgi:DNA-binding MarR family transcriptional regulator